MKSIELLSIGVRLLGIYFFIDASRTGIYQYQTFLQFQSTSQSDMAVFTYFAIIQVVLLFLASLLMLKFPVSIAKWLLPKTHDNEVAFDGSTRDIEISIFSIVGVYILSWAIPDLFHNSIWWWYSTQSDISDMWDRVGESEYIINLAVTVVEAAIGLYLCLRAQGLSNLLRRLREAGAK